MLKKSVLFILKKREDYGPKHHDHKSLSTGLYNSAKFVNQMLIDNGIESNIVVVNDNNDIDREVTKYKPTHVIIEALWVVPEKFKVLHKLHPNVKWIVRMHSEIPFIANEGNAMTWLGEYVKYDNVSIAFNAKRILKDFKFYIQTEMAWNKKEVDKKVIYLPNYFSQDYKRKKLNKKKHTIDIACFGAVRPLKNHLNQAIAALRFAESIGKRLHFHINIGRFEMKGDSVYKNLKGLFDQLSNSHHKLVEHEWMPREEFLDLCSKMDIGMQSSFSETFNIVGCDLVSQGVPLIGSPEIVWMNPLFMSNPTSTDSMVNKLCWTYHFPNFNVKTNQFLLTNYTNKTQTIWVNYFK
jgi:hypothetical protein